MTPKKPTAVSGLQRGIGSRTPAAPVSEAEAAAFIEGTTPEQVRVRELLKQKAERVKPVRITVDLSPADYEALNHWIGTATARINSAPGRRVTLSRAVRAMISASILDDSIGLVVTDLLRRDSERT
jgi:hypothetical protein